jgi:hypothetical protein
MMLSFLFIKFNITCFRRPSMNLATQFIIGNILTLYRMDSWKLIERGKILCGTYSTISTTTPINSS